MLSIVSASPTPVASSLYRQFDPGSEPDQGFDKRIPYLPKKYDHTVAENQKHLFPDKTKIVCRHLATQWIIDRLFGRKVDYGLYRAEAISTHVRPDSEQIYRAALKAADIAVVDNTIIGQHLADIFSKMESLEKSGTGCFLEGPDHSMAMALQIKTGSDGVKKYVVTVYDPNMTGTHTRFAQKEVLDPFDLTRLSTKDLLGEDRDADYFGPSNTSCLAVFDTGQLTGIIDALEGDAPPLAEPPTSKAAVIDFTIDTINSTHIFHLLSQGCDQTLLELKPLFEHLQKTDSQKLLRLALARSTDKDFGLCYALHMGHAKAIEVFKELLMTVPVEKRASLLQRATQNGLALALQSGHADAVLAYAELIELVPEGEDRLALLMAISPEGITLAMQNGHAPAIRACATLMQALTPEHRAILLTKIAGEGTTLALRNGHMDALIEYAKILTSIPAHNRLALLIPGDPTQRDALIESLRDAKSSQIRTFLQILLKFSALNTPGALVEYVNLVREAIPDDAREGLKNTPTDNRLQFLFAGAQDEGLIVSAFDSAAAQDKEALLNMWQEFGLTDSFVLAMSSFVS